MTARLEKAVEALRRLPDDRQEEVTMFLEGLTGPVGVTTRKGPPVAPLSATETAEVEAATPRLTQASLPVTRTYKSRSADFVAHEAPLHPPGYHPARGDRRVYQHRLPAGRGARSQSHPPIDQLSHRPAAPWPRRPLSGYPVDHCHRRTVPGDLSRHRDHGRDPRHLSHCAAAQGGGVMARGTPASLVLECGTS